jgi:hypothetical protein
MADEWRVAESLQVLLKQLNEAFPQRSKASDGGIGDANHATSNSDHNPHIKDKNGMGVVTARDYTHDPVGGIDCDWLCDELMKHKDPRIKYIIWNKQMVRSYAKEGIQPWTKAAYTGANAHTKHLHLSVQPEQELYDSKTPWELTFPSEWDDEIDDVAKVTVEESNI